MATQQDMVARIAQLEAALAAAKAEKSRNLTIKAAQSGGLSVYGLTSRFPVTLYANQWVRLIDFMPEIKAALAAGKWADKNGDPIEVPADWRPAQRKAASK